MKYMGTKEKQFYSVALILAAVAQAGLVIFFSFSMFFTTGGKPDALPESGIGRAERLAAASPSERAASDQRIALLEAELTSLQQAASKDPARPTMAQLQKELDQLVAERRAEGKGDQVSTLLFRVRALAVLSVFLAAALFVVAFANLTRIVATRPLPDRASG